MVASAKLQSPARVVALDCNDGRLEIAKLCGADIVLNPRKEDVVKAIRELTDGYGCDAYLEASGNPASVVQGIHACRKAATFVEYSVFKVRTHFPSEAFLLSPPMLPNSGILPGHGFD